MKKTSSKPAYSESVSVKELLMLWSAQRIREDWGAERPSTASVLSGVQTSPDHNVQSNDVRKVNIPFK